MMPVDNENIDAPAAEKANQRDAWVKPEITSFDVVVATRTNNGINPGDGLANAS